MGLTKQYLRYSPETYCGLVGTGSSVQYLTRFGDIGRFVAVSACENVIIWDLRKRTKVSTLSIEGHHALVTSIEVRPPGKNMLDNTHIAVGYSNGTLAIFEVRSSTSIKFNGHLRGIKTIAWDSDGMRVASGSEDGEIVLWDMVSEKGIVRLRGHAGWITRVRFMSSRNVLISSCRDSYIKFWDLDTFHCFRTLPAHRVEVWDFIILKNDTRLISGSSDAELRVWNLHFKEQNDKKIEPSVGKSHLHSDLELESKHLHLDTAGDVEISDEVNKSEDNDASNLEIERFGSIMRSRGDKVYGLITDGQVICCYSKSKIADFYIIRSEDEIAAKLSKRLKKSRKRAIEDGSVLNEDDEKVIWSDEIKQLPSFTCLNKISGLHLCSTREGAIKIVTLLNDNCIVLYGFDNSATSEATEKDNHIVELSNLHLPGHQGEIRAISFTSIADQIVTAGADSIKVWDRDSTAHILHIKSEYTLSMLLPPGDRHVLIGTKTGRVQLYEIGSGTLLEDVEAHESNDKDYEVGVWTLALKHDGKGFVSAGSDCLVKFWSFELVQDTNQGRGKRLSFIQDSRALKVADQVTCIRCSQNGKFVAVATLDQKETIYYIDSLKLFHELYGKPMPSTCLDFSSDSTIIVTGCKDSCIRIYGTDFGDQRKLLKGAHVGGVTDIKFIAETHYFFSCGADSTIKQWDADNFQRITTLKWHHGIVRCLAVSNDGKFLVTASQDKSIRLWRRSEEFLILEEEREEERRLQEEQEGFGAIQRVVIPGEESGVSAVRPTRTTVESEKAADLLLEALAIYREQRESGGKAEPHQLMKFVYKTDDPLKFLLLVLRKIKSSELEEAILILPLHRIFDLLVAIKAILEKDWDIELSSRVAIMALRVNLPQLVQSPLSRNILTPLSKLLVSKTQDYQDTLGFNLAGLKHLKDRVTEKNESQLFVEAAGKLKDRRKKTKKKQRQLQRAIMVL